MTDPVRELLGRALALSEAERAEIAAALLRGLDGMPPLPDEQTEIDAARADEICRRVTAYREGKATLIDADEIFASLRTNAGQ